VDNSEAELHKIYARARQEVKQEDEAGAGGDEMHEQDGMALDPRGLLERYAQLLERGWSDWPVPVVAPWEKTEGQPREYAQAAHTSQFSSCASPVAGGEDKRSYCTNNFMESILSGPGRDEIAVPQATGRSARAGADDAASCFVDYSAITPAQLNKITKEGKVLALFPDARGRQGRRQNPRSQHCSFSQS